MRSTLTVGQACANWLAGRHGLRKSAKAAYRNGLQPVHDRHGEMPIQALEKRHFDELVADLMAGGAVPVHVKEGRGVRRRYRQPWEATTINPMLNYLESRCYWATACAKAGVKRIRLHGARHTCGTHASGAQRACGDHQGVARARRHRVHYAHLRTQPTGEARPRGREHLVMDEA
jgi:hypothetical protein